jgi:CheY-like chemotaxis protein
MRSDSKLRQIREVLGWIEEEAFCALPPGQIHLNLPAYLPPVPAQAGSEPSVRRVARALKQLVKPEDQLLATAFYEDRIDEVECCVCLMVYLERAGKDASYVEHRWADEIGDAAERLLTHSVELKVIAGNDCLTLELRLPVYAEGTVAMGCRDTILLVEDDGFVRRVTREVLETDGRCVLEAQSAEEGLRVFARNRRAIGLVVCDVTMPGRSGIELAGRLHRSAPTIPILLTSGYSTTMREDVTRNIFCLEKPYDAGELLRAVSRCLHIAGTNKEGAEATTMTIESC